MGTEETKRLDDEVISTWNAHDVEKFVSLCADDIVWHDVAIPEPLYGKEAAGAYMQGWMTAFPDMTVRQVNRVVADDAVAVEVEFDGTNTGPMTTPDGDEMPATGSTVKGAKGAYFARVQGGKIAEVHSHPDIAGLLGQLGVLPGG